VLAVHYRDNPWFPDVLQSDMDYDQTRDPQKHAHIWLGAYQERSEAAVFTRWQIMPFDAPHNAMVRFGCDWGYAKDPTVLVRCFIGRWQGQPGTSAVIADPKGDCLFVDHEAWQIGCEIDDLPALFAGSDVRHPPRWQNRARHTGLPGATKWQITADCSRPETISYLTKRGFRMEAAAKGANSVEEGITFLQNYDIYVHPRCRRTADELLNYRWKVDRQTGAILSQPEDANNHLIDALRYGLEGVRRARSVTSAFGSAGRREMVRFFERYEFGLSADEQLERDLRSPLLRRGLPY